MFGRTLTAVLWGVVADRYGTKPVMVISILSVIIFNTLFGLSTTYWMAIATRALLGFLCGLLGPIKASASEVCRKEHQALGLSLVTSSRAIALVVDPAIGGFVAQPATKYPNIFSENSLFRRFPYFLPSFAISVIAVGAFIACFWLPLSSAQDNSKLKRLKRSKKIVSDASSAHNIHPQSHCPSGSTS